MLSVTRPVGSSVDIGKEDDSDCKERGTRNPIDLSAASSDASDDSRLGELLFWSSSSFPSFEPDFRSLLDDDGVVLSSPFD